MNELGGGRRTRPWNFYPNNKQQQQEGGGVWKNMNLGGTTTTSNSMNNAISFGIVATVILISMFLIMAILEHLFRPSSSNSNNDPPDGIIITPLDSPSSAPKSSTHLHNMEMTRNARDLSVVMPGQKYPSCIAQPAPLLACPTQGFRWHSHHPTFHSFSP